MYRTTFPFTNNFTTLAISKTVHPIIKGQCNTLIFNKKKKKKKTNKMITIVHFLLLITDCKISLEIYFNRFGSLKKTLKKKRCKIPLHCTFALWIEFAKFNTFKHISGMSNIKSPQKFPAFSQWDQTKTELVLN